MKLLLDENLPDALCEHLSDLFEVLVHVRAVGLEGKSDGEIWSYALMGDLTIVSKDSDFVDRALISNPSAKVIWIKLGNCTTANLHLLLRNSAEVITAFSQSTDVVLELPHRSRLEP